MSKVHIYDAAELTAAVLAGVPISATCGFTKLVTREDVGNAQDARRRVCKGCAYSLAELGKSNDVAIQKPEGWTRHLERSVISERTSYTVTIGGISTWGFPPAA